MGWDRSAPDQCLVSGHQATRGQKETHSGVYTSRQLIGGTRVGVRYLPLVSAKKNAGLKRLLDEWGVCAYREGGVRY